MAGAISLHDRRRWIFFGALALLAALLASRHPIAQAPGYHAFADQRELAGLPHFWNVASNLPFLVLGAMGLRVARTLGWRLFFSAVALVAAGSSWYHLAPSDATLVWDRLPIGLAFAALFCAVVGERIDAALGRRLLPAALGFAVGAVFWWRATGDLTPWVYVQLAPMLAIALAAALLPAPRGENRFYVYALVGYAGAKVLELGDDLVLEWTAGATAGHALKHLAAAGAVGAFYCMLARRRPG